MHLDVKIRTRHGADIQVSLDLRAIFHLIVLDAAVIIQHYLLQPGVGANFATVPGNLLGHGLTDPLRKVAYKCTGVRGHQINPCKNTLIQR